jgi:GH15 family glucan-1,4-alpha-glucosidase
MEGITSGGDNSIGGNIFNTYASNNCTIREQQTTDNWLADSQDKVFGSNKTTEKDGRYYILPTDAYMNVNLETALSNYNSFEMPDCFKWANVDLSVDMYGKKRAATTYRGAYDPNAGDASGIEDVYTASGKKLTVKALGNGNFAIDGAEGTATVYDMAGRVISRQNVENGMVSIADAANGIYIVRVSGASVKVAR